MELSTRLSAVKPSPTLALNAKAKALAQSGADVASFAAGEPDFDVPAHVKDALKAALDAGFTKYTATGGIPELKAAIAAKLKQDNQLTYGPDQLIVSTGAKQSLYNAMQALLSPGDEVVMFAPYWVSYADMVSLAGGTPVVLPTDDDFLPGPAVLKAALGPRVKAVFLNSPGNPTGAVLGPELLRGLAAVLRSHGCFVVTDDIYEKLWYRDDTFHNILNVAPELYERTLVVNGLSKAYAMTGLRLGYAAGPKAWISGMQLVQDQSTSNATSVVQKAAVAALTGPQEAIAHMVKEYRVRRDLMVAGLNAIPGVKARTPQGAFYVMADVRGLLGRRRGEATVSSSAVLSELLLEHQQVAAVPGEAFGAPGYLRFSFATSREVIAKGLSRLATFAAALS